MSDIKCLVCNADEFQEEIIYSDDLEFRGLILDVEGLKITKCVCCGYTRETDSQREYNIALLSEAHKNKAVEIRERFNLLLPNAITVIREALGLTYQQADLLFYGTGAKLFKRIEAGIHLQEIPVDRMLRLMYMYPNSVEKLQAIIGKTNEQSDSNND